MLHSHSRHPDVKEVFVRFWLIYWMARPSRIARLCFRCSCLSISFQPKVSSQLLADFFFCFEASSLHRDHQTCLWTCWAHESPVSHHHSFPRWRWNCWCYWKFDWPINFATCVLFFQRLPCALLLNGQPSIESESSRRPSWTIWSLFGIALLIIRQQTLRWFTSIFSASWR